MHKAQIVSPILDMQIKQRSYKKHMDTLVAMKPAIDTSKPPPVPRLDVYKKRVTRERIMQLQIENENIKVLKNIGKQRNKSSKAYKTAESLSDEDFIEDWEDKLNLVDVELNSKSSNGRPTPLLSDLSKIHSVKNVINDDGMEVVDEGVTPKPVVVKPFDSSTKKRPNTSRSGLRRLNPLKKPSNRRRHQQQEEEDYNDNDIDDDEENDSNADFVYNKNDNDDYNKYSSDSSCSFSEEENINTNEKINYPRKKIDDEDEDSFDRYDKASETTDRNADRSIQLFSGNLDDFESSSKSNKSESSDVPRKGNGGLSDSDQESNILSKKRKNEDSNTEEMRQSRRKKGKRNNSSDSNDTERTISNEIKKTSKESYSKNDDGFDNFEDFEDDDESEEKAQKDKSDVYNSINNGNDDDDDLNMDSIPEF
ncbi:hypothetical protein M9Y10_006191 [Tritrichomonas musculus]|uniref:Uncharacterized protein n=1 Tax=Tritrichomonas musculus TaxID=1915356 RepID=A0ABR2JF86_9EUKA